MGNLSVPRGRSLASYVSKPYPMTGTKGKQDRKDMSVKHAFRVETRKLTRSRCVSKWESPHRFRRYPIFQGPCRAIFSRPAMSPPAWTGRLGTGPGCLDGVMGYDKEKGGGQRPPPWQDFVVCTGIPVQLSLLLRIREAPVPISAASMAAMPLPCPVAAAPMKHSFLPSLFSLPMYWE